MGDPTISTPSCNPVSATSQPPDAAASGPEQPTHGPASSIASHPGASQEVVSSGQVVKDLARAWNDTAFANPTHPR